MNDETTRGIGHNEPPDETVRPPLDLAKMLDLDQLEDDLCAKHAPHFDRVKALMAGAARMCLRYHTAPQKGPEVPESGRMGSFWHITGSGDDLGFLSIFGTEGWVLASDEETTRILLPHVQIRDEATQAAVTSFVAQMKKSAKPIDDAWRAEKQHTDAAGDLIISLMRDGLANQLTGLARTLERGPMTEYATWKTAEERRQREEAAREAREKAEAAAKAALEAQSVPALDTAIDAAAAAQRAEKRAAAPVADLARTHGAVGGTTVTRTTWKHEVVDITKLPAEYLLANDAALAALAKTLKEKAKVEGVRFYADESLSVRRS